MKEKFKGDLKYIDSKLLVKEDKKEDKVEDFFITLGIFFNDLKGYILFIKLLEDRYEKPEKDEVTVHAGNFGGVMAQIHKLVASTIYEFFQFLKENQELLSDSEFNEILGKLSKPDKDLWDGLFAAARNDLADLSDFFQTLLMIRNNLGFHYYQSGKTLRRGYKSFFNRRRNGKNDFAYYSIGKTVEATRFFFSDAAADEAAQLVAGKEEEGEENDFLKKYREQLLHTINVLNLAIINIFKKYIQSKRNRPH